MNNFLINLTNKISELYKMYETYIWKNENRRLAVIYGDNLMITFYLFESSQLIDEISLSFDKKEYDLYKAICLRTFIVLLGNVMVHKMENDDVYYNNIHKPYLALIVKDKNVATSIDKILVNQLNVITNFNIKEVVDASNKVNNKVYSKKFLNRFDARIKLSREMLKRW